LSILVRSLGPAVFSFLLVMPGGGLQAQGPAATHLGDYVGTYADTPDHPVEILNGDEFFAVQDEAKYRLIAKGTDAFSTQYGPKLTFKREASGTVTGYEQNGKFHPRTSTAVTPESAAMAWPRPKGQNSPSAYRYHPPANLHDGIAVGDIARSDLGVETANAIVHAILDGTYKDVHSVLLYQNGKLVMEEYFYGYSEQRPQQLRSATKSVVSALAGIAIDRGALSGVTEKVLPQMSYSSYANPDPRKAAIMLGDFLSMSSGLDCNDHSSNSPGRETVLDDSPDWVKATLDLPMINDPGTKGYYCSGGVAVVGRMTENAVHMRLPEFAQANLFQPLGIARTAWTWNYDLTNADKEYSQIHLRPRDMLNSFHGRGSLARETGDLVRVGPRLACGTQPRRQCQLWLFLVAPVARCSNTGWVPTRGRCRRPGQRWAENLSRTAVPPGCSLHRGRLQRRVHSTKHDHGKNSASQVAESCEW
jgi:CubicO group peptidase (beta-lactamase class C family)